MSWSAWVRKSRPVRRRSRQAAIGPARRLRPRWREALETLAFMLAVGLVWIVVPVQASR